MCKEVRRGVALGQWERHQTPHPRVLLCSLPTVQPDAFPSVMLNLANQQVVSSAQLTSVYDL